MYVKLSFILEAKLGCGTVWSGHFAPRLKTLKRLSPTMFLKMDINQNNFFKPVRIVFSAACVAF